MRTLFATLALLVTLSPGLAYGEPIESSTALLAPTVRWHCNYGEMLSMTGLICSTEDPEVQAVIIPLYAPPMEKDFTTELAQTLLCGSDLSCTAQYYE